MVNLSARRHDFRQRLFGGIDLRLQLFVSVPRLGKDGSHRTSIVFANAIRSKQGLITRYVVQLVDITERKQMENELSIAAAAFQTRQAVSITDGRRQDAFLRHST